jgi:segregation and condensation protein B
VSEQDVELGDTRSEVDEVLTSGADSVAQDEPGDAREQAGDTLGVAAPVGPDELADEAAEVAAEEAAEAAVDEESSETLDIPLADLRPALEAVLMVADQPLDHMTLASAVGYPPGEVASALHALAEEYAEQGRGFDLRNVAGGWRYYTREEFASVVERFVLDGQRARLTQAALETLAVVAYKQPVSRARVSAIRGVNVDGVMRTLVSRGLVEEAGHDAETTATLYRTTGYFLERIGVTSLEDLPELAPFLPEMGELDDLDARAEAPESA